MPYRCTAAVLGSLFVSIAGTTASAQLICDPQTLTASDAAPGDQLGSSVAISGDTMIVGARLDDDAGIDAGAAYIYRWVGDAWIEEAKLLASDGEAGDQFGRSVSISGEYAIVGAHLEDDNGISAGSAYIFRRESGSWSEDAKILGDDTAAFDFFGWAVAIDGDTAVVGAYANDSAAVNSGVAYIFVRKKSLWSQQAQVTSKNPDPFDYFGISVAISGETVLVGAYLDDRVALDGGSAYVFTRAGIFWSQQTRLSASDAEPNDFFGLSVGLSGDIAIIGAQHDDDRGPDSGSAYIFARNGVAWTLQTKVTADDGEQGDKFGSSVSVSGETAIIGAAFAITNGPDSGSVYVFGSEGGLWTQQQKLSDSGSSADDQFGRAVAVYGNTAIIGAAGVDGAAGADQGAAVVFERVGSFWSDHQRVLASNGAAGDAFGSATAIDGDTAIVGAPLRDVGGLDAGSAYFFERTGLVWSEFTKFTPSDGSSDDQFGTSVSLSGDTAVIGSPRNDGLARNAGAAYVYVRSGLEWLQQALLTADDGVADNRFGTSVAIFGDRILVGSYLNGGSGSAYIFERIEGVWTQQAKLKANDAASGDAFGFSVALGLDTAIIGARNDDDNESETAVVDSGSAYIFSWDGELWSQQAKLAPTDPSALKRFGWSVSLFGDTTIIGARGDSEAAASAGAAYVYRDDGVDWLFETKLTAPDAGGGDRFGWSVSIEGESAVVGSRSDDDAGSGSGSAYIFSRRDGVWQATAKLTDPNAEAGDSFGRAVAMSVDSVLIGADADDESGLESGSAHFYLESTDVLGDCTSIRTHNLSTDTIFLTLSDAISIASPDEVLLAAYGGFHRDTPVNLAGRSLDLMSTAEIRLAHTATMTLADGVVLAPFTGHGLTVYGSLSLPDGIATLDAESIEFGEASTLTIGTGSSIVIVGHMDTRIDSNERFDLASATLRIDDDAASTIEIMSEDIGPDFDGYDRFLARHFPIGELQLGANSTLDLVDVRDNDDNGQTVTEALYIANLVIGAGAFLNSNGIQVYYQTLTNGGGVDNAQNFTRVSMCDADLNLDRTVDGMDLAAILAAWGTDDRQADINGDGVVDGMDLAALLAAWGACP